MIQTPKPWRARGAACALLTFWLMATVAPSAWAKGKNTHKPAPRPPANSPALPAEAKLPTPGGPIGGAVSDSVAAEINAIRQAVGIRLLEGAAPEAPLPSAAARPANDAFQATLRKLLDQDFPPLGEVHGQQPENNTVTSAAFTWPIAPAAHAGMAAAQRGFYAAEPPAPLVNTSPPGAAGELLVSLRALARQLEGHAANLEDAREFRQADHWRRLAETLRLEARELEP